MTYRGVYDSATQYEQLDVVRYQSAAYLALTGIIGEAPGTSAKWGLIVHDGVYSAEAGSGISLSGNTISIAPQLLSEISGKVTFVETPNPGNATETGKVYYATVGSSKALIVPVSGRASQVQFRLDRDGKLYSRRRSRPSASVDFPPWGDWTDLSAAIDPAVIPDVISQIVLQYLDEHGVDLTGVERTANKVTAIGSSSNDTQYPSAKAVYDAIQTAIGTIETQLSQV